MSEFGAWVSGNHTNFRVWAPYLQTLKLKLAGRDPIPMERDDRGYFFVKVEGVEDRLYTYLTEDGSEFPDPASRYQPQGVNGPSQVVNTNFDVPGLKTKVDDLIIYELHVGTFSPRGDFQGVVERLDYLTDLGVNAIEIMPVAQFPGKRGWGYDGVYLYAVQESYGGPCGLRDLVVEAHSRGLAVILDVVYNHVGPEGNYLSKFGPYLSNRYVTPWGPTFNYDDRGSDEVRKFILENVRYWLTTFNLDGLRLDAIHGIFDFSPKHILKEIADLSHSLGKFVIAESDLNDPKVITEYGVDAQWVDDFHHAVHAYVTGERNSYYSDFGRLEDIEKAFKDVFVYDGRYSKHREKTHGAPVRGLSPRRFVVYIQNHDQVGNRGKGERLSVLVQRTKYFACAALYILSPFIPMLFMGEEYGETAPFLFFTDYSDPGLAKAVREGRLRDNGQESDPQSEQTFQNSKLTWKVDEEVLSFYKKLISLRKYVDERPKRVLKGDNWILVEMDRIFVVASFGRSTVEVDREGKLLLGINFPEELKRRETIALQEGVGIYSDREIGR
jgi:maltooligosyltrehalose trehalohydrolase